MGVMRHGETSDDPGPTSSSGAQGEASGNCHLAGEHTSQDFQDYLNGAVESGQRAADEILAALK